jgi:hypothetical protein
VKARASKGPERLLRYLALGNLSEPEAKLVGCPPDRVQLVIAGGVLGVCRARECRGPGDDHVADVHGLGRPGQGEPAWAGQLEGDVAGERVRVDRSRPRLQRGELRRAAPQRDAGGAVSGCSGPEHRSWTASRAAQGSRAGSGSPASPGPLREVAAGIRAAECPRPHSLPVGSSAKPWAAAGSPACPAHRAELAGCFSMSGCSGPSTRSTGLARLEAGDRAQAAGQTEATRPRQSAMAPPAGGAIATQRVSPCSPTRPCRWWPW